jgi:hypothetical protein
MSSKVFIYWVSLSILNCFSFLTGRLREVEGSLVLPFRNGLS